MSRLIKQLENLYRQDLIALPVIEFTKYLNKTGEEQEILLVTGAAVMHYHLSGHICTHISDIRSFCERFDLGSHSLKEIKNRANNSGVIGSGETLSPMVLEGDSVYLHRFWKFEQELIIWLQQKSTGSEAVHSETVNAINDLFDDDKNEVNWQKVAVYISHLKKLTVITGGPGTGKTYTIDRIIRSHLNKDPKTRIALSAPTGKAAQRLNDSLQTETLDRMDSPATTIHSLLGAKGSSGDFFYNKENKLPYDIIVIDEASMLDLNLWIHLIRAIPEAAGLILLGDKNQLASVEAGSILGDICSGSDNMFSDHFGELYPGMLQDNSKPRLNDCIVELEKSYRFSEKSGIKKLSEAIINEDSEYTWSILKDQNYPDVQIREPSNLSIEQLMDEYVLWPFSEMQDTGFDHEGYRRYQILCALRKGPYGVGEMNRRSEYLIKQKNKISQQREWYTGRPVIINRNHKQLKLRNGETGFARSKKGSGFEVFFEGRDYPVSTARLPEYECSFGITVHKSQGSEYENVALLLPKADNSILTKELLYTSVTRARRTLLVIGNRDILSSIVMKRIERRSGIQNKLWQ